jgi:hypothetical protein
MPYGGQSVAIALVVFGMAAFMVGLVRLIVNAVRKVMKRPNARLRLPLAIMGIAFIVILGGGTWSTEEKKSSQYPIKPPP